MLVSCVEESVPFIAHVDGNLDQLSAVMIRYLSALIGNDTVKILAYNKFLKKYLAGSTASNEKPVELGLMNSLNIKKRSTTTISK